MRLNFGKDCQIIRVHAPVAAGAADITDCSVVDTAGFDSLCYIVGFGAIVAGAATSLKAQQANDSGGSPDDFSDVAGTAITVGDDQDNKLVYLDLHRPQKRYSKLIISRATQNSTVDLVLAVLYNANVHPVTQGATVMAVSETHMGNAEGTA